MQDPRQTTISKQSLRPISFCLLFSALAILRSSADEEICPAGLKNRHNDAAYTFGYQSWSWDSDYDNKKEKSYAFCNCVRNRGHRHLFVDWEKANLKGFIRPGEIIYSYSSFPNSDHKDTTSPFWYGAKPEKIDAVTRVHVYGEREESQVVVAQEQSSDQSSQEQKAANRGIWTESRISIPSSRVLADYSPAEIAKLIQASDSRELLVDVLFEFSSTPLIDEAGKIEGIRQHCTYELIGDSSWEAEGNYPALRIEDPQLHATVFRSEQPVEINTSERVFFDFEGISGLPTGYAKELLRRSTRIDILDTASGNIIGSMPISYYKE